MTIWTNPIRRVEGLFLEDYTSSPGEYLSARAREAWERSGLPSANRMGEIEQASGRAQEVRTFDDTGAPLPEEPFPQPRELSPMLSPEEATARGEALGLKFSKPTRSEVVDIMVRRKKAEVARQSVIRRSPGGFGLEAGALGLGLLVTAADPLNIAAAFIPVVREARFAVWAGRVGVPAARFTRGTIEGAAGAAVVEPLVLAAATQEQADYDMTDSLLNVAFGTALGGGLHVGGGALADVAARRAGRPTLSERLSQAPHAVREAALRTAVAQSLEGRLVDVEPVLTGSRVLESTTLRETLTASTAIRRAEFAEAVPGRPEAPVEALEADRPAPADLPAVELQERLLVAETAAQGVETPAGQVGGVDVAGLPTEAPGSARLVRSGKNVRIFASGQSAEKYISRRLLREHPTSSSTRQAIRDRMAVVRVGRHPDNRAVVVEDANTAQVRSLRQAIEPGTRRAPSRQGEPPAGLKDIIERATRRWASPESVALADFRGAARADDLFRQIPADERSQTAQAFLDDAAEQADELRRALGVSDDEFAALSAGLDDSVDEALALGKAARAAALCELRR